MRIPTEPRQAKRPKLHASSAPENVGLDGPASHLSAGPDLSLQNTPNGFSKDSLPFEEGLALGPDVLDSGEVLAETRQSEFRLAAAGAWNALLPRLVYPLMEAEQRRRQPENAELPKTVECRCVKRTAKVLIVSFQSMCIAWSLCPQNCAYVAS